MIERWDERSAMLDGATLLVNTTSLGMKGQPPLDLDLARLPKTAVVDDIVYVPLETPLLAAARARGNSASTVSACCCTRAAWASRPGSAEGRGHGGAAQGVMSS